jgi:replication-associated recombination protein RarA
MENINKDFNWVLNVLDSCETLTQVRRTEKLFENFKNIHKEHFKSLDKKDETKKVFKENFKKSMREKISAIEKL